MCSWKGAGSNPVVWIERASGCFSGWVRRGAERPFAFLVGVFRRQTSFAATGVVAGVAWFHASPRPSQARRDIRSDSRSYSECLGATSREAGLAAFRSQRPPERHGIAITDLIIPSTDTPGAKAAHVNRYIDLFLRDGSLDQREAIVGGLAWLDAYAIREYGHAFVKCAPADQVAMLKALDEGTGAGHSFFRQIKSLTSRICYATEIGGQELNKGGRVPASFGCAHGSHA